MYWAIYVSYFVDCLFIYFLHFPRGHSIHLFPINLQELLIYEIHYLLFCYKCCKQLSQFFTYPLTLCMVYCDQQKCIHFDVVKYIRFSWMASGLFCLGRPFLSQDYTSIPHFSSNIFIAYLMIRSLFNLEFIFTGYSVKV